VEEIAADGGKVHAIHADNTDLEAVKRAVESAASTFGRIDILVNNQYGVRSMLTGCAPAAS